MLSAYGYALGAGCSRLALAPFIRHRVLGAEHVPAVGSAILAPNHISHFDPPLIGVSTSRQVDWMAMRELFTNPILGGALHWIGSFPVGRGSLDRAAVRIAIERLKSGRLVGLFPEGGLRTGPESVLEGAPLRPGVAALSQIGQAPVIPCAIIGTDALYDPWRWMPLRRTRAWTVFGPPLTPPPPHGDKATARKEFESKLGQVIRELYTRTVREEGIPRDCLPQTPQHRKGKN